MLSHVQSPRNRGAGGGAKTYITNGQHADLVIVVAKTDPNAESATARPRPGPRRAGGLPLSNRLIREIHETLMSGGRGRGKTPGEFRRSQTWIGGTRPGNAVFVPPPHTAVPDCMAALEESTAKRLPQKIRVGCNCRMGIRR